MHPAELLRVTLFVAFVVGVYVLAASAILRRRWRGVGGVALVLALLGLGCFYYGWRVEPYRPEITQVPLVTEKLPPHARPVRIVHLSDLHCDRKERLEPILPGLVAAQRPDLIVFTGDAVNTVDALPTFRRTMTALARIAPTFGVRGNWDTWFFPDVDLFADTGVRELDGDVATLRLDENTTLALTGVAVGHEERLAKALAALPATELSVFLYHSPDLIKSVRESGADLYCAGHTHGGQVALPLYGALVTFSRFGKKYESGLFHQGATTLYVNRGIGMEGGFAPRVRFCARPEITVYEIAPATALAYSARSGVGGVTAATSTSPVRIR